MANSLTAMSPTYWSKRMNLKLLKETVFRALASFEERSGLTDGAEVDRPYRSDVVVENYTKGSALTAQDLTATSNKLQVDIVKALLMYVDNVDKIQNKYSAVNVWADEAARRLSIAIDAEFLYEVTSAADSIDDGDLGGTAGNGITLTTSNVLKVFSKSNRKLDAQNVPVGERFFAMSPEFKEVLWEYIAGKESLLGDKTGEAGNIGTYAGFSLYLTNNLTGSVVWTPANQPSDGDTITIQGITFTFETSTLDAAGKVKSETDLDTTLDHLAAFINAGGATVTASGYALSAANQRTVQQWTAEVNTAGTAITIYCKGASYVTASGSDTNDVFTAAKQIQHCLAGRKKAIDVVIQKEPSVEMASTVSAGKAGVNILPMTLFGVKTFYTGTYEILDVQIRSDAY